MPNWCSNSIEIRGSVEKVRELWLQAKRLESQDDGQSLLEAMAPIGEWDYDRAIATWGIKWDVSLEGLEFIDTNDGNGMITGYVDSAWGPPIEAFESYVANNPDVFAEIKYFEPGMSFIGIWDSEGGDFCFEDVKGLLMIAEDDNEPLVNELLEFFNAADYFDDLEEVA